MRRVRNEVKHWDAARLLLAIKATQRLTAAQAELLEEEVIEMAVRADNTTQGQREIIDAFLSAPALRDEAEKTLKRVARRNLLERGQSQGRHIGRVEGRAEGRAQTIDEQADAVVRLLARRSIKLSRRQEAVLRKKSAKQMVPIIAAVTTVTSASEFARKARLNGRGNGRANGHANGRKNGRGNGKG